MIFKNKVKQIYRSLENHRVRKEPCFVYISEINLGWKWLTLIVFTQSIIQLPPKKGAQYGFDMPNCYQKSMPFQV